MPEDRRLVAIMFSDIVDYTAIMHEDKEAGLTLLRKNRYIQQPLIEKHNGKCLKEMGDATLAQFSSAIDSVLCALEIQRTTQTELSSKIRIGIHLGDVTIENDDIFGDGVNIASRLQSIADPGGIYISESIYEAVRARKDIHCQELGDIQLKNVDHLVKTYFLKDKGLPVPSARKRKELTESHRKPLFQKVGFYIILLVVVAGITLTGTWISNKKGIRINSIAILPVDNLSGNETEKWLEAGIHNGLIDEMTKIKKLRVAPRRNTLKYDSTDKSLIEIAGELDVEGIIKASFLKTRNSLNLQVRLIQTSTEEKPLWRQTYNCDMQNVLTTYSEVARDVAKEANIPLTSEEDSSLLSINIVNPAAYQSYLMGMDYYEKLTDANLDTALQFFELARKIDPEYAPAYLGIANFWGGKMIGGYAPYSVAGPKLRAAAEKGLSLDSTLTHNLAGLYTWGFWEWETAEKLFLKSLELNPNDADANRGYSHFLAIIGKPEEGLPYSEKAIALDRLNPFAYGWHGMTLRYAHRFDEAIEILEEALVKFPGEMLIYSTLRSVYHDKQMYDEAIHAGIKYYEVRGGHSTCISALEQGYREGGYQLALQRNAEALIEQSKSKYITPNQVATLYSRAGKKDEALEWLEKAYEEHDINMPYINTDPIFDYLREDPRFKELVKKMKFPE